jgi:BirA family biotin operon repressor/biotin-[acetyl-CoA-carboxylase] ligase
VWLRRVLRVPAGEWESVDVVDEAPSTNAALVDAARAAARAGSRLPAPAALAAEHQTAGLGRAGRTWTTPPRAALTVSALLRPAVRPPTLGWLPLLAGVAVVRTLREAGQPAALKWPNDVLLPAGQDVPGFGPWRKVAGVLAHVVPADADGVDRDPASVVVGIGLNVSQTADELPVPTATSLALAGATAAALDRSALLAALLRELDAVVGRWSRDDGDPHVAGRHGEPSHADEYAAVSATLGMAVRAELAGGDDVVEGTAARLAADGSLVVVQADGGERAVAAGDVHHLRRA